MTLLYVILSYFIGSIPFSYIAGKIFGNIDIRKHGSGNTGATNVYRTLGKKAAIFAFIGDFLKGFIIAIVAKNYLDFDAALFCGTATVLGHCYSPFLKFKGGKGVATAGGTIFGFYPLIGLILVITLITVTAITKIMSVASITVSVLFPILSILLKTPKSFIIYSIFLGAFVVYKHKANIKRLLEGKELKI